MGGAYQNEAQVSKGPLLVMYGQPKKKVKLMPGPFVDTDMGRLRVKGFSGVFWLKARTEEFL